MKFNNIHLYQFFSVTVQRTHIGRLKRRSDLSAFIFFMGSRNLLHLLLYNHQIIILLTSKSAYTERERKYSGKDCIWLVHLFNGKAIRFIKYLYRFHEVRGACNNLNKMPYPPKTNTKLAIMTEIINWILSSLACIKALAFNVPSSAIIILHVCCECYFYCIII